MMQSKGEIVIVEEPQGSKKFRYSREPPAGEIQGVNTTRENPTHPSIKIINYTGEASIYVSCVRKDEPYAPHPHILTGKDCANGVCHISRFFTNANNPTILSFSGLRICCTKKDEIETRLRDRRNFRVNPFNVPNSVIDDVKSINMHGFRLCFQAIIRPDPEKPNHKIQFRPKVSQPIMNSAVYNELRIRNMCDPSSPSSGGKKILLFCNKISRDDIRIRFFEESVDKQEIWSEWVHSQNIYNDNGIAFLTPAYRRINIETVHDVFMELVRPSDNARSNPVRFRYIPTNNINMTTTRKQNKIDDLKDWFECFDTMQEDAQHQQPSTSGFQIKRQLDEMTLLLHSKDRQIEELLKQQETLQFNFVKQQELIKHLQGKIDLTTQEQYERSENLPKPNVQPRNQIQEQMEIPQLYNLENPGPSRVVEQILQNQNSYQDPQQNFSNMSISFDEVSSTDDHFLSDLCRQEIDKMVQGLELTENQEENNRQQSYQTHEPIHELRVNFNRQQSHQTHVQGLIPQLYNLVNPGPSSSVILQSVHLQHQSPYLDTESNSSKIMPKIYL
ncbi:Embryonic polarity protein dorsal [Pseudolycoriella hygida]|uniref:Embryonic polarity protein dorsal n=1 Tax=Pseudolycoriella hygida TaxID=35572 RepID=A0A9Q0NAP1_9DIPT|nr:Embryonic polarity protein dorsal [Pseudolycoriella hygida]